MPFDQSKLDALASAYVRRRQPNARLSDIARVVATLHQRIDCGELAFDAVVSRLQREVDDRGSRRPAAFGDIARACRDLDGGHLAPRERTFVKEMVALGFNRSPSPRQVAWLAAIFSRLQRKAAA